MADESSSHQAEFLIEMAARGVHWDEIANRVCAAHADGAQWRHVGRQLANLAGGGDAIRMLREIVNAADLESARLARIQSARPSGNQAKTA